MLLSLLCSARPISGLVAKTVARILMLPSFPCSPATPQQWRKSKGNGALPINDFFRSTLAAGSRTIHPADQTNGRRSGLPAGSQPQGRDDPRCCGGPRHRRRSAGTEEEVVPTRGDCWVTEGRRHATRNHGRACARHVGLSSPPSLLPPRDTHRWRCCCKKEASFPASLGENGGAFSPPSSGTQEKKRREVVEQEAGLGQAPCTARHAGNSNPAHCPVTGQ